MSKSKREFLEDCGTAVVTMFNEGIPDPSAQQIAERVWGSDNYISDVMIEDVRRKLPQIRAVLEADEYQTCPLSRTYYRNFRRPKKRPKTADDARRCSSGKQFGLLGLGFNPDLDMIWHEFVEVQANSGAAKAGRAVKTVAAAMLGGRLAEPKRAQILGGLRQLVPPPDSGGPGELTA